MYEFNEDFRSYCDTHFAANTLNTSEVHSVDALCGICNEHMGSHNSVKSLQVICCDDNRWYHKACLKQMAFALTDDFDCPACDNREQFRENMQANGIYIPSRDYMPKPDDMNPMPSEKRRRIHKIWTHEITFSSKSEALEFIRAEKIWSYHYKNKSDAGVRVSYRCNLMKCVGQQCAAGLYLLYDSRKASVVHLYRADTQHDHDDDEKRLNAVSKIAGELEKEIRDLFEMNTKPKSILYRLVQKGFVPPTKAKLTTFLTKLRKEKFGSEKLHFGSLQKWLTESSAVPTSDDEPFIVAHEVNVDEENIENSTFRFFVSTKLLLRNAINVSKFHTDATYKLVWQGFPVIVVGTTDSDRKFHPFGASVSTNEKAADFSFIFRVIKEKTFELYEENLNPDVLISDAAFSIHNGFEDNFPSCGIIMCWAHLRRVVAKNIMRYLKTPKQQNDFLCKFALIILFYSGFVLVLNGVKLYF